MASEVLTYLFAILGCWIISDAIKTHIEKGSLQEEELENAVQTYEMVKGVGPLMQPLDVICGPLNSLKHL